MRSVQWPSNMNLHLCRGLALVHGVIISREAIMLQSCSRAFLFLVGVTRFTARKPWVFPTWAGLSCKFIICIWVISPGISHFSKQVKNLNNSRCPAEKISPGVFPEPWRYDKQRKPMYWPNDQARSLWLILKAQPVPLANSGYHSIGRTAMRHTYWDCQYFVYTISIKSYEADCCNSYLEMRKMMSWGLLKLLLHC